MISDYILQTAEGRTELSLASCSKEMIDEVKMFLGYIESARGMLTFEKEDIANILGGKGMVFAECMMINEEETMKEEAGSLIENLLKQVNGAVSKVLFVAAGNVGLAKLVEVVDFINTTLGKKAEVVFGLYNGVDNAENVIRLMMMVV